MTNATVSVHTDPMSFSELRPEWTALYRGSPIATPFQSWEWISSWWRSYGASFELRLVAVRESEELIGLIPLMVDRRRAARRLLFVGTGISDHLDMLARPDCYDKVSAAGARCLREMRDWHVADLQEVPPTAAVWHLYAEWQGFRTRLEQSRCPVVEVRPWDEVLSSLSRNQRGQTRKTLRRLEEDGVTMRRVAPDAAGPAVARFIELHRHYWRGRGISREHERDRFQSHIERVVSLTSAAAPGGLYEYVRDEEIVAGDLVLAGPRFVGEYLSGMTDYVRGRFDFQTLLIRLLMDVAGEVEQVTHVSLLRGEEPAKLRWNSGIVVNERVVLARNAVSGTGYAMYQRMRRSAAAVAAQDQSRVREWADRIRGLHRRARATNT
jgi:CelD/BcsL family acetyltransferase involved in cellulose biosynthesis